MIQVLQFLVAWVNLPIRMVSYSIVLVPLPLLESIWRDQAYYVLTEYVYLLPSSKLYNIAMEQGKFIVNDLRSKSRNVP
jgi:hypothetical protein